MTRRDAVLALLAFYTAPLIVRAQQSAKPARIAWLGLTSPEGAGYLVDAFKQGMRELGYIEGKNFVFEVRWAFGKAERLPDLAKELVALKPDVILAATTAAVQAAQRATVTIPIVAATSADPIRSGVVRSRARRSRDNVTGRSGIYTETSPKTLELLLAVVPKLTRVAVLVNFSNPFHAMTLKNLQTAAQSVGMSMLSISAQTSAEIEDAFRRMIRENVKAAIVPSDSFFLQQRRQIAELASKRRMPTIFVYRENVEAGGLMSYGPDLAQYFRHAATYVDKILKGGKPGDLPVEQPTTFELVVNLKAAKALGITIPKELLLLADRVIE